nr:hypothetical transcript [Hymenolepis microstoma]
MDKSQMLIWLAICAVQVNESTKFLSTKKCYEASNILLLPLGSKWKKKKEKKKKKKKEKKKEKKKTKKKKEKAKRKPFDVFLQVLLYLKLHSKLGRQCASIIFSTR